MNNGEAKTLLIPLWMSMLWHYPALDVEWFAQEELQCDCNDLFEISSTIPGGATFSSPFWEAHSHENDAEGEIRCSATEEPSSYFITSVRTIASPHTGP